MTEARTMGQLQEEILSTVRKSEAAVIEAIETWTAKVRSIRPGMLEKGMPFTSRLPDPHELIASAYDFAEQLLANQRKFAEDVLKAMAPPAPADGEVAKKNGAAPVKKTEAAAK